MKHSSIYTVSIVAILMLTSVAFGHNPLEDDGSHTTPENAIPTRDISISQVVYHEVTPDSAQIWLTFDAKAGDSLYTQIGVPKLDRLSEYRPAYAILGPGLAPVDLPFDVPEGYGGWIVNTEGTEPFDTFYEEFTGTDSWRFQEQTVTLPATGTYYLVAYVPSGEPGKLWLALGTEEAFTLADILRMPRIILETRSFHEVGPIGGLAMWALITLAAGGLVLIIML